jgi:hypothetical protein
MKLIIIKNKAYTKQLQRTWVIDLMESWFCIWNDLVNPNNGLNLVINPPV